MYNLKREIECGLKAKIEQLNSLREELEFFKAYELYLMMEIDVLEYKILKGDSFFTPRLLEIRKADLEKNRSDIKSQLILIEYFQSDIDLYFVLKK